jgi:hypothetical protein
LANAFKNADITKALGFILGSGFVLQIGYESANLPKASWLGLGLISKMPTLLRL